MSIHTDFPKELPLCDNCGAGRLQRQQLFSETSSRICPERKGLHPQKLTAGTWKWWFPIGISFSKGPFSGSMFVLGDVPRSIPILFGWDTQQKSYERSGEGVMGFLGYLFQSGDSRDIKPTTNQPPIIA